METFDYTINILDNKTLFVSVDDVAQAKSIDNLIHDLIAKIETREYHSKYNSYIVFDYEPFLTEGFRVETTYIIKDKLHNVEFAYYLVDKYLKNIVNLRSNFEKLELYTDRRHTKLKESKKKNTNNNDNRLRVN